MSGRPQKQSMSELKYRRLVEHNQRLKDDLMRPRIRVSEASASLIRYCKTTKDALVLPSVWGPVSKADDPYATEGQEGCQCVLM
ncbi:G-protein gamma subunit [Abortiporus biennis]|nr:G-protein gamma subunit [Abortiporus biennis]